MPTILDFSHIYETKPHDNVNWLDLSNIEGTNLFCSNEASTKLRQVLANVKLEDIHFLDNGNYHYLTIFFLERIKEPFNLVLFDHHTDMQDSKLEGLLSCGNWVQVALDTLPQLQQVILIGPPVYDLASKRVLYLNEANLTKIKKIPTYISIDKDVLSPKYSITNWNQGKMSLFLLEKLLADVFKQERIIGVDICGECSFNLPMPELAVDEERNYQTNKELLAFIEKLVKKKGSN